MENNIEVLNNKLKNAKDIPSRIQLLNDLAWEFNRLDPKKGIALSKKALQLAQKKSDQQGIARALLNIGACNLWISEYRLALKNSLDALHLFEELNDALHKAQTLYNIGTVFYYLADYPDSLQYYMQSLRVSESIRYLHGQANALNGVGLVYSSMNEYEKARKNYLQSLRITGRINDKKIQARVLDSLSANCNKTGNYRQAIQYALQCVHINEELGDQRTRSYAFDSLGDSHRYIGEHETALSYYQQSLEIRESIGFKSGQAITLSNIGDILLEQGKCDEALRYNERALQLANKINTKDVIIKTNKALATIYERKKNTRQFIKHFKAYYRIRDEVFSEEAIKKAKSLELLLEIKRIAEKKDIFEASYKNIKTLNEISRQITATLDLEKILNIIYEHVNDLMDATVFGIGLYNPKKHVIEYRLAIEKGKRYKPYTRDTRDKNQLAVWCIDKKKQVFINNTYEEFKNYIQKYDSFKTELEDESVSVKTLSIIYLPIIIKNNVIGVLSVQSFKKNAYKESDLETLKNIASYAAIALENARLYEEMEEKVKDRTQKVIKQKEQIEHTYENIKLMSEIGNKVTSILDVEKIAETVYENVNTLMDATVFCIGLHNPKKNTIDFPVFIEKGKKLSSSYDLNDDTRFPVVCFKTKKEILINDLQKEYKPYIPYIPPPVAGELPESLIYLPLLSKDKAIGVITVESFRKNAYTRHHLDILRNLAVYTATAMENALLYTNMEDQVKDRTRVVTAQKLHIEQTYENVKLLSEIGKEITATLSVEGIIKKVYQNMNNLMDASVFWIGIYNKTKNRIDIKGGFEKGKPLPFFFQDISTKNSISAWCFNKQQEVFINDIRKEYKKYVRKLPPVPVGELPESAMIVPLISKNKPVGVITVQSFIKGAYNEYHLNFMRNLAIYTVIALENAHLYENMEEEVKQRTRDVVAQKEQIEKQNQERTESMNYAGRIQKAMLPSLHLLNKTVRDYFIFYRPKDIVSGDFYWYHEQDGKLLIAAVDCTGHGVPGALMSMVGNTLLNEAVIDKKITDPGEILMHLDLSLKTTLQQEDENTGLHNGMDLSLCMIDSKSNTIRYAGALCPIYIIRNKSIEVINADIFSIGSSQTGTFRGREFFFANHDINITDGMTMYMFSDGYMDQYGGKERKKMGSRMFKEILLSISGLSMNKQKKELSTKMEQWKKTYPAQIDDMLILGLRF